MADFENGTRVYRKLQDRSLKARTTNPATSKKRLLKPSSSVNQDAPIPRYEAGYETIKVDNQNYAATPKSIKIAHEDLLANTFKDFVLRTWDKEKKKK
jgi:hypothetical protein